MMVWSNELILILLLTREGLVSNKNLTSEMLSEQEGFVLY